MYIEARTRVKNVFGGIMGKVSVDQGFIFVWREKVRAADPTCVYLVVFSLELRNQNKGLGTAVMDNRFIGQIVKVDPLIDLYNGYN